eukprot:TRINITY_DN66013_c8_g1_i1.p1 TRINITY_DN66013_c8_g1~~TRINITY_DN66013_c8_g1_i1.p1  ORF type:complete len:996 (-),score=557.05 TRINITY_DN66013_c8_g1_i1:33-2801(-)
MSKRNKKMLQMMGLRTEDVLASCFNTRANGNIKRSEYQMFWGQAVNDTEYLEGVLKRLAASMDKPGSQGVSLESLVQTIQFITLFLDVKAKPRKVMAFVSDWAKRDSSSFPPAKEVVRMLSHRIEGSDVIGPVIIGCSTLHSVAEFQKLAGPNSYPTYIDSDIRSGESVFLYSYLVKRALANPSDLTQILQNTVNKMLTLPQQMKMNPKVAETTQLALLHMCKSFLSMMPLSDPGLLKRAITTVSAFYLWPKPFGSTARDLLLMLKEEGKVPGQAMRAKFDREAHTAEFDLPAMASYSMSSKSADDDSSSSGAGAGGGGGGNGGPTVGARPTFVFAEEADDNVLAFVQTMSLAHIEDHEAKSDGTSVYVKLDQFRHACTGPSLPAATRAMLVLNLLATNGRVSAEDAAAMRGLSKKQVAQVYNEAMRVVDDACAQEKPSMARHQLSEGLVVVRNKMEQLAKENASGETIDAQLPSKLPESMVPELPPIAHLVLNTRNSYKFLTKDDIRIACFKFVPYPTTPILERLEKILDCYQCSMLSSGAGTGGDGTTQIDLRLIVSGTNQMLHNMVCAYMSIIQQQPHRLKGLRPRFYLVPMQRNYLASWLARHDSWYNRHVYVPFRSKQFVLPWIEAERGAGAEKDDATLSPPGAFLRGLISSYVRDAQCEVDVNIYNCEAWIRAPKKGFARFGHAESTRSAGGGSGDADGMEIKVSDGDDGSNNDDGANNGAGSGDGNGDGGDGGNEGGGDDDETPDHVVPFVQRLDVGLVPYVREFARKHGLGSSNWEEIMHHKDFAYRAPELETQFTKVDMDGNALSTVTTSSCSYTTLLLSNVPRRGDKCSVPHPSAEWMELHAAATEAARKNKSQNVLVANPTQHVNRLTIRAAAGHSFYIRLDGQNFGPYQQVRISSTGHKLPIQTFFPISL